MPNAKASEVLIQAKALFGRHGQKWTRFHLKRHGLCGQNYCSLGAINGVGRSSKGIYNHDASHYLSKAIREATSGEIDDIIDFNDMGTLQPSKFNPFARFGVLVVSLIPGVRLWRWHRQIKPVWCRAIKMALDAEEKETAQLCSSQ